jgi:hypothetical protein
MYERFDGVSLAQGEAERIVETTAWGTYLSGQTRNRWIYVTYVGKRKRRRACFTPYWEPHQTADWR